MSLRDLQNKKIHAWEREIKLMKVFGRAMPGLFVLYICTGFHQTSFSWHSQHRVNKNTGILCTAEQVCANFTSQPCPDTPNDILSVPYNHHANVINTWRSYNHTTPPPSSKTDNLWVHIRLLSCNPINSVSLQFHYCCLQTDNINITAIVPSLTVFP